MNSRERFAATVAFQPVDRPLMDYRGEPAVDGALCRRLGAADLDAALDRMAVDLRVIAPTYVGPALATDVAGEERDVWGIVRRPVANPTGTHMEPVNRPWAGMRSVSEVEAYPWPRADWYDFSAFPALCDRYRNSVVVFGRAGLMDLVNGVSFGRGVEQVLLDIASRDDVGLALFRKRFEFMFEFARHGLESAQGRVDILFFGEDLGTQQSLIISPATWREIFKPYMKRMIALAHQFGAKAMMHSCGSVAALVPEFIEIGLDVLQAVQPTAAEMAPEMLARRFGGRLVFNGTMDTQGTLPFGSVEEVRKEVRSRKKCFASCGGFILGPCHNIQMDTPVENILALYSEGAKGLS